MRTFALLFAVLVFPASALSATFHVPGDHNTIQEAIDAAVNGDMVLVHPGTFLENLDYKGKAITVKSSDGPLVTVIDGGNPSNPDFGSAVLFQSQEGADAVLEGFTLTHGTGTKRKVFSSMWWFLGGGVCCDSSSPTIRDNIFTDNHPERGGGVACLYASPVIEGNRFTGNSGGGAGIFGIFQCHAKIRKNLICDNDGKGIFFREESNPLIEENVISGNHSPSDGGGIYIYSECAPSILHNIIVDNVAEDGSGGGIECRNSSSSLIAGNVICHNYASSSGGGICCGWYTTMTVSSNLIAGNSADGLGGGLLCSNESHMTLANNTIVHNHAQTAGGLFISNSDLVLTNVILRENTAKYTSDLEIASTSGYTSNVTIQYSNVNVAGVEVDAGSKLLWGAGNIDTDPLFADGAGGDYHLRYDSPCRETGKHNPPGGHDLDFEGDPRLSGDGVDMGADEFHTHLYCTGDHRPYGYIELKVADLPGTGPVFLWAGSGILDPPWPTLYGDWYLQFPLVLRANLGAVPSSGILYLFALIPPDFPAPVEIPLQALSGSSLTNCFRLTIEPL